jgi:hypothetical protein
MCFLTVSFWYMKCGRVGKCSFVINSSIVQFILAGKKQFLFLNVNVSRDCKNAGPRNRLSIHVIGPEQRDHQISI